jgi:hypothetical protein
MKTTTLVPQVVQVVREGLIPVLAKMCGGAGVEPFLNDTDRSLAHSALEGTRQALEAVLTETETGGPDARAGEGPKLQSYALHTALGLLNIARRVERDADGQTQGDLDLMQLWHGCTLSVREQSAFLLAQGTSQEAREAMLMFRHSVPSESTIKRLVATDGTRMMQIWDMNVPRLVQEQLAPVLPMVDMASVSADGAMVPLRGTESRAHEPSCTEPDDTAEQASARAYREARIITVSLYGKPDETRERLVTLHDEQGKPHGECVGLQRPRLATLIFGEMPGLDGPKGQRAGKALAQIVAAIHQACPESVIKGTTDGGRWPEQTVDEVIGSKNRNADFYHATEHLRVGSKAAFGESELGQAWYKRQRNALLTDDGAAEAIAAELRALAAVRRRRKKDKKTLEREAGYFEKRAPNMNYAQLLRDNMVIGSGLVEAGVKRLITLRMKRTGATWGEQGGNAIITLRSLRLSGLWDVAWRIHVENEKASYACAG